MLAMDSGTLPFLTSLSSTWYSPGGGANQRIDHADDAIEGVGNGRVGRGDGFQQVG